MMLEVADICKFLSHNLLDDQFILTVSVKSNKTNDKLKLFENAYFSALFCIVIV